MAGTNAAWLDWKLGTLCGWRCHGPPPYKGIVLVLHGLGEHSRREGYITLAKSLASSGFLVYAYDHRGHGATAEAAGEERLAALRAELEKNSLSALQRYVVSRGRTLLLFCLF